MLTSSWWWWELCSLTSAPFGTDTAVHREKITHRTVVVCRMVVLEIGWVIVVV